MFAGYDPGVFIETNWVDHGRLFLDAVYFPAQLLPRGDAVSEILLCYRRDAVW